MNIVIVYGELIDGANEDEQDTLVQVDAISHALRSLGHTVTPVALSLDLQLGAKNVSAQAPDLVFNLVESIDGQGRLIHLGPSLLDALRIPYTGAGTAAMFLTSNKILAKQMLQSAGMATPDWYALRDLQNGSAFRPGRYIAKSVWEHASIGLSEDAVIDAADKDALQALLTQRLPQLAHEGFIEAYIDGREFNLALLAGEQGPEVLPPAEIRFDAYPDGKLKIVDYRAKWEEASFEYANTPRNFSFHEEDDALIQELRRLAVACWHLFDLRGYARVDFRVDTQGIPWILEINANPCLSPDAGFMAAAQQAGLSQIDVVQRILRGVA